ncbi:MAG TPA: phage portal protein [Thermosynergistes sp.]|nr:phage portal protein [Thermosynergistes sp.]
MGIWQGIKRFFNKRASPLAGGPQWFNSWIAGGGETASGIYLNEEDLLRVSAVYACINLISNTIASLPVPTYERVDPRGRRRAREHWLYDIIQYQPNEEMTSFDFRKMMQAQLELFGNCYAYIVRNGRMEVVAMWPIPAPFVRPFRNDSQDLFYEVSLPDKALTVIPAREMFHIRGLSNDAINGYRPLKFAREIAGLALAAEQYGASFFANGAVASGIVEIPGRLSEQAMKNFKESFRDKYEGLGKAHRVLFLEEGLKWHQITIQNDNAQFIETRKYQTEEVARFFGVPLHKISSLEKPSYASIEHMSIEFVQDCLRPRLVNWEQQIRRQLLRESDKKKYYVEFVIDGLLRGDVASRSQYYSKGRNDGWLSANDIRELENMNPIPAEEGGDAYLVNGNMVAITSVAPIRKEVKDGDE